MIDKNQITVNFVKSGGRKLIVTVPNVSVGMIIGMTVARPDESMPIVSKNWPMEQDGKLQKSIPLPNAVRDESVDVAFFVWDKEAGTDGDWRDLKKISVEIPGL